MLQAQAITPDTGHAGRLKRKPIADTGQQTKTNGHATEPPAQVKPIEKPQEVKEPEQVSPPYDPWRDHEAMRVFHSGAFAGLPPEMVPPDAYADAIAITRTMMGKPYKPKG